MSSLPRLELHPHRHFLQTEDGAPFFLLADTAWELFHRCDEVEARRYLANRAGKGFNVVQAVALAELDGLHTPNTEGELPLHDLDPARPNQAYFAHVDRIVAMANELGLHVAMLPTWGCYVHEGFGKCEIIFNPDNARAYGEFLGRRYREAAIIWVLGGDRPADGVEDVWHAMAAGIKAGDGGRHLMTYHPRGVSSSSSFFHDAEWLDMNMIQSSHGDPATPNWRWIAKDYHRTPTKPVWDGEPCYEDIDICFQPGNGRYDDYMVRRAAYWSVFAGSCGHTYGASSVWQMYKPPREPVLAASRTWEASLNLPGAGQMRHLRALIESRPFFTRIPDPSIGFYGDDPTAAPQREDGMDASSIHLSGTRDGTPGKRDATFLMLYQPIWSFHGINTSAIAGKHLRYWWYDPRDGCAYPNPEVANTGVLHPDEACSPKSLRPQPGPDWVLVVDDAACAYPPPGQRA